jgi:DNA-binding MarR family transcriptional regulator
VRRAQDAGDRRGVNVSLTPKGVREINRAIQHRLDVAEKSLAVLSDEEQVQLADLLRKVVLSASRQRTEGR